MVQTYFSINEIKEYIFVFIFLGDKHENIYFRRSTPVATAWMCSFRIVFQIGICSGGRWPPGNCVQPEKQRNIKEDSLKII